MVIVYLFPPLTVPLPTQTKRITFLRISRYTHSHNHNTIQIFTTQAYTNHFPYLLCLIPYFLTPSASIHHFPLDPASQLYMV
jgi:hypothetical protein